MNKNRAFFQMLNNKIAKKYEQLTVLSIDSSRQTLLSLFPPGSCLFLWLHFGPPPRVPICNDLSSGQNAYESLVVDPHLWILGFTNGGPKGDQISFLFLLNCDPLQKASYSLVTISLPSPPQRSLSKSSLCPF